ncbi:ComEC/Rec2 family competence protein [Paracoccus cavernae]|uniref:ComEC/Rec2 family competence protein n=1 Tax=Paracoccus cavernae TaxID=1571207 RepID=UPI00364155E1
MGYTRSPIMLVEPPSSRSGQIMTRLQMRLSLLVQNEIPGQSGAVAAALMTGDRSGISETTNEIMRISSLYHIISISGLHMSMLAGLAYGSLRFLGALLAARAGRSDWPVHKAAALGAFVTAATYLALSGGGVATERAFLMVAVLLLAVLAGKRVISLRNVALVALAILVVAPESLTSASFQMSFAATVALILGHRHWAAVAPFVPPLFKPVAMLLFTSLLAGLATGPFAAAHFGRIAPYGMLANLLAVPVVGIVVMPMGLLATLLAPIGLAGPPLWLMGIGTGWMLGIAESISALGERIFWSRPRRASSCRCSERG